MTKDKIIELLVEFGCEVAYKERVFSEFFPSMNNLVPYFLDEDGEWRLVTQLNNPSDMTWIVEKMRERQYTMQVMFGNNEGYIVTFKRLGEDVGKLNKVEKETLPKAVLYAAYDAVRRDLSKKEM